eukprot:jgi/Botrbrau1/19151/Bobra.0077s0063.1
MQLDLWTKGFNVTTTDPFSDIVNALPGFCEEHGNTTETPIDFNVIVNSAVPPTVPVTVRMCAFILQTWWNVKGLHSYAAQYCRSYIWSLHSKWSSFEKLKRGGIQSYDETPDQCTFRHVCITTGKKAHDTLHAPGSCSGLAINVKNIEGHIEVLCNIIQSHAKAGKTSIACSTAKQRLREAAATKARATTTVPCLFPGENKKYLHIFVDICVICMEMAKKGASYHWVSTVCRSNSRTVERGNKP